MGKYIRATDAADAICAKHNIPLADLVDTFAEIPREDVERVVRCRDCVYDDLATCPLCYIEQHGLVFINHDADFYCAKGKRNDEEDEEGGEK